MYHGNTAGMNEKLVTEYRFYWTESDGKERWIDTTSEAKARQRAEFFAKKRGNTVVKFWQGILRFPAGGVR